MGKKKKGGRLIFIVAALAAAFVLSLYFFSSISVDEDHMTILYGEHSQLPQFHASIIGVNADNHLSISDDIDLHKTGSYTITARLSFGPLRLKTKTVDADVVDVDAPQLTLAHSTFFVKNGDVSWKPEYYVKDNYDSKDEIEVSLKDSPDFSKNGTYHSILQACDASGNCTSRNLTVCVGDGKGPDFTPSVFHLSDFDAEGKVLYQTSDHALMSDEQFDEIYWIGDSNYVNMSQYGGLNPKRVLARMALSPSTWNLPVYYDGVQTALTIEDYVKKFEPKYIIIGMGLSEAGNGDPDKLAEGYGKCIDSLLEIDPKVKIIVSAIMPVRQGKTETSATQEEINAANYALLQMAERKHVRMIDSSVWLADPDTGYGFDDYYLKDGYHLDGGHYNVFTGFVKYTVRLEDDE